MSRRRATLDDGSLELLLDTICNTFGGIIFISFLVVLLLNNSSSKVVPSPADQVERAELKALDNERESLTRRLERVRRIVASTRGLRSEVIDDQVADAAADFREAQERAARLAEANSEAVGRANQAQDEVNEARAKQAVQAEDVKSAEDELQRIQEEVQREVDQRSEDAVISRISATSLAAKDFLLKGHRLYGPIAHEDGSFNERECLKRETDTAVIIEPNPAGGVDVDPDKPVSPGIRTRLSSVSPGTFYARIWTWNDSYAGFVDVLRPVIDELQIKFQIIPLTEKNTIRLSDKGPPQEAQ